MGLRRMTLDDLCSILTTSKRLVAASNWRPTHSQLRLAGALEADGVVIRGVSFMAVVLPERPDEKVALLLQAEIERKPRAFARVDWRGAPHGNLHRQCRGMRLIDAGRTHFHDPCLHAHFDFNELFLTKLDLPVAAPIEPEPPGFHELLALSADLLHIENLTELPIPPWQPRTSLI